MMKAEDGKRYDKLRPLETIDLERLVTNKMMISGLTMMELT